MVLLARSLAFVESVLKYRKVCDNKSSILLYNFFVVVNLHQE